MTSRTIQTLIAIVFLLLGGWALFFPQSVVDLTITPEYREDSFLVRFAMACFGAQACLFGLMALFVRFTSRGFLVLGIALIPFFFFDYYFHQVVPVLNGLGMLDLVGNMLMFMLCILGWRRAVTEERGG